MIYVSKNFANASVNGYHSIGIIKSNGVIYPAIIKAGVNNFPEYINSKLGLVA
ncbi:hypothetical protein DE167_002470 [Clostridium beijerinckii]|nr:hypothetical protein [Clostridium beijerinckii]